MTTNIETFNCQKQGFNKVQIVYFSGTGGTRKAAMQFEAAFKNRGSLVEVISLDMTENGQLQTTIDGSVDLLLLLFPVYAFDAPEPVYEWINQISQTQLSCAVISVSGGGEVWPNTTCRISCIKRLEKKGLRLFYERMLIMPSNIFIETPEQLRVYLLRILPLKIEHCVNEISSNTVRRTKKSVNLLFLIPKLEKMGSKVFGKYFKTNNHCTGCGICADQCPRKNIMISKGYPQFGNRCILCLRCIYGCPENAIYSKIFNRFYFKNGFNLERYESRLSHIPLLPLTELKTGILFIGIKKYLNDINE